MDYLEKLSYSNKKKNESLSSKSSSKASIRSSSSKKKKSMAKSSSPSVKARVLLSGKKRNSMFSIGYTHLKMQHEYENNYLLA